MIRLLLLTLVLCKDPQHHAYKMGPKFGRYTHWIALILIGAAAHFCPTCWRTRLHRLAT